MKDKDIDQDDSSDAEETAQEKRIRLAKEYIAELEKQGKHTQNREKLMPGNVLLCRKAEVRPNNCRP